MTTTTATTTTTTSTTATVSQDWRNAFKIRLMNTHWFLSMLCPCRTTAHWFHFGCFSLQISVMTWFSYQLSNNSVYSKSLRLWFVYRGFPWITTLPLQKLEYDLIPLQLRSPRHRDIHSQHVKNGGRGQTETTRIFPGFRREIRPHLGSCSCVRWQCQVYNHPIAAHRIGKLSVPGWGF